MYCIDKIWAIVDSCTSPRGGGGGGGVGDYPVLVR